jgi:lipid A 3-O-deacylase
VTRQPFRELALLSLLVAVALASAGAAWSADVPPAGVLRPDAPPPTVAIPAAGVINPNDRWEFRLGGYAHDPFKHERGRADVGVELVAPELPINAGFWQFLVPRPHVGGVFDTGGRTSYVYAGAVWTWNLTPRIFFEPIFGATVHNGKLDTPDVTWDSLGCRLLFHTGTNLGYRFTESWNVSVSWEHSSNAKICGRNVGLNNFGAKIGFSF